MITDEVVERASIAAYAVLAERASKWYPEDELYRYKPWAELSDEWKNDYRATIRAALEAAAEDKP